MSTIESTLLYVSRKTFAREIDEVIIGEIIAVALSRNAALNVTGALVATSDHFAQILEGPAPAITELMDSIHRDSRHKDVTVLREAPINRRSFAEWSMAYSGPSSYVAGLIAPLVGGEGYANARVTRLISLMTGFAAK
jgi:hypothetical protein